MGKTGELATMYTTDKTFTSIKNAINCKTSVADLAVVGRWAGRQIDGWTDRRTD